MDHITLALKGLEYTERLPLAQHLGDREKIKRRSLAMLVILRQQSRYYHNLSEDKWLEARALERSIKKADAVGIAFPLGEQRVKALKAERDEAKKTLASVGECMCNALDIWQQAGATFEDLCSLCNKDPDQVKPHLLDGWESDSFSKLATVYNLDYRDIHDTGWLEDSIDAPLTHALKAYMLDLMLNTEIGQQAAHEALVKTFPGIMDHMVRLVTDEDGVQHLYDKDGIEFGTVEDNDET